MPAATRVLAFLLVFSVLFLFALAMTIVSEFTDVQWVIIIVRIGEGLGRLTLVSIVTAFILVEGIPMLAAWLKKEMVKEAEERGREEADRTWAAWLEEVGAWEHRKAQADREGKTFIEPRPEPPRAIK